MSTDNNRSAAEIPAAESLVRIAQSLEGIHEQLLVIEEKITIAQENNQTKENLRVEIKNHPDFN